MKKISMSILVLALLTGGCLQPRNTASFDSFQLVYHSDTRGFYNPCG